MNIGLGAGRSIRPRQGAGLQNQETFSWPKATFYATLPELVYSPFVPRFSALDIKLLFDILYPICAVRFQYHRRRLLVGIVRSPLAPFTREGFCARLQIRHRMYVVPVMVRQRW